MEPKEEITEIVEAEFSKVSGVTNPANGTAFLLLKEKDDLDSTIESNAVNTQDSQSSPLGPEMNGMVANQTDSYEEMEKMLEEALIKGFCGMDDCEV